jgi:O-acetylhomoserine/O-acetylserine sulfhydrylase-like pyridoxal-dependent enzyme
LTIHAAKTTLARFLKAKRERLGISADLIRIAVGLEDADELIADFDQALD